MILLSQRADLPQAALAIAAGDSAAREWGWKRLEPATTSNTVNLSIQAKWNDLPPVKVEIGPYGRFHSSSPRARWVGFRLGFSVKRRERWAVKRESVGGM